MRRIATGIAALALGLGGCGGDDEPADGKVDTATTATTGTTPESKSATPRREAVAPPKVPAETARDVASVRSALKAAGYTVKDSEFPGKPLAQLEVGATLVAFYASASEAAKSAAGLKKAFAATPGRGLVRSSANRLYTVGQARKLSESERSQFSKIVSTSEGAV